LRLVSKFWPKLPRKLWIKSWWHFLAYTTSDQQDLTLGHFLWIRKL
jgi:hypothetical protein